MMTMKGGCAKYSYILFVMLTDISEGVVCSYSSLFRTIILLTTYLHRCGDSTTFWTSTSMPW